MGANIKSGFTERRVFKRIIFYWDFCPKQARMDDLPAWAVPGRCVPCGAAGPHPRRQRGPSTGGTRGRRALRGWEPLPRIRASCSPLRPQARPQAARLRSQVQVMQNVPCHRAHAWVSSGDKPPAVGRGGRGVGVVGMGSARRNGARAGPGHGAAWEPPEGHAQPWCQGGDRAGTGTSQLCVAPGMAAFLWEPCCHTSCLPPSIPRCR